MKICFVIKAWTMDGGIKFVANGMIKAVMPNPLKAMMFESYEDAAKYVAEKCETGCYQIEKIFLVKRG